MDEIQARLEEVCNAGFICRGLDESLRPRMAEELKEVFSQAEAGYLLDLHDEKAKFPINENNLLITFVLGLVDSFDLKIPPVYVQGEYPDIDTDYLPVVRDYLKNEWAPKTFGRDKVCSIGTYGTLGIKMALKDMTRVHGIPRDEIELITKKIPDKDDDGKELEWDKAIQICPDLKDYCERYPDVADAVHTLLERNKSGGVHAGGLIISSVPITDFVPLEVRSVNKDNKYGVICSAWGEGLRTQDLGAVGLVKFDLLVVDGLRQIALTISLIKNRYGKDKICALPGQRSWSDVTYLNDKDALKIASRGDTRCIFQFGSDGIRKLLKKGGVDSFDDIAAYSALYRPGPMGMGMHDKYCARKKGLEKYSLHPLMRPILGYTYGVMTYQEQVMKILNVVGDIPLIHCEKIRKAISKKKIAQFIKYKEMFLKNGVKNLSCSEEYVQNLWDQVEAFSDYGFNKSMLIDTLVPTPFGNKRLGDFSPGDTVYGVDDQGSAVEVSVVAVHDHGTLDGYEVTFDDGSTEVCSQDHKFLTPFGQMSLWEICQTHTSIYCAQQYEDAVYGKSEAEWLEYSLRSDGGYKEGDVRPSHDVRGLQGDRMEKEVGWDCRRASVTMRTNTQHLSHLTGAPSHLSNVQGDQGEEHSGQDGEIELRQSGTGTKGDLFGDGKEDIGQAGDTSRTCCSTEGVAGGQSGRVRQMHRGGVEVAEAVPHGSVAQRAVGLGDGPHSLWRHAKAGGFREGFDLDRGGWPLPLERATNSSQSTPIGGYSTTRCDAECGGEEAWEYHAPTVEHGVFQEFVGGDEARVVPATPGHAGIADARGLVLRRVVRVVPVGERQMYDLEVASDTHNFLLTNGVVTSNSHSYAYSYISVRQLYLMAHYPLEFYTAVLMCESDSAQVKIIKLDAERHNIELAKVHINNSDINFAIKKGEDEKDRVFFGFSNLKNLGERPAERIVEQQPYDGFEDFIERFGTDGTVMKALVSLGTFCKENERLRYYKFAEFWKDWHKKKDGMRVRFKETLERYDEDLATLLLEYSYLVGNDDLERMGSFTEEAYELWEKYFSDTEEDQNYNYKGEARTRKITVLKKFHEVKRKREQSIKNNKAKEEVAETNPPTLAEFNPNHCNVKITDDVKKLMTIDPRKAEDIYYGWQWRHDLEDSPDYQGWTFDWLLTNMDGRPGHVQIQVISLVEAFTKKGKQYFNLNVEDANGQKEVITIWPDDVKRFQEELVPERLLAVKVKPPEGNWTKYTFDGPPPYQRYLLPKEKSQDIRIYEISPPVRKANPVVQMTIDEDVAFLLGE